MKIAINLLPYTSYQGIEVFTQNLVSSLIENNPGVEFVAITHSLSPDFVQFGGKNVERIVVPIKKKDKLSLAFLQQTKLYGIMKRAKPDFLFSPSLSEPFFCKNNVVLIYDCAYDRFHEAANIFSKIYFKLMYLSAKLFAKKILTISDFSRRELEHIYKINPGKISVIYGGLPKLPEISEEESESALEKFNLQKRKFFMYVGNTRPRKNIPGMLKAFKIFSDKHSDFRFVLVGKPDDRFLKVQKEIEKAGLDGRKIVRTGFISDKEKTALYKNSQALIFASFYEGFGLPILEAQSLGIPVLTSNTSSLPEIGSMGAVYADPYNVVDIAKKMESIYSDEDLRSDLIENGYENLKRFSWEKTAEETIKALREINENS